MSAAFTISFLGDIYLNTDTQIVMDPDLVSILRSSEYVVANLEAPLTKAPKAPSDRVRLRSRPEYIQTLKNWGIHSVSLANNHMFDFGVEGFNDCIQELQTAGISWFGAGRNLEEATRPLIVATKGVRIGFLSFATEETKSLFATSTSYGCSPLDLNLVKSTAETLANKVDAIILCVHWGLCEYPIPSLEQCLLAKKLANIPKVAAIIGHHSHVLQGITQYKKTLVAFSLGNFSFSSFVYKGVACKLSKDNQRGAILKLEFDEKGICIGHVAHLTKFQSGVVEPDSTSSSKKKFTQRCEVLLEEDYSVCWKEECRRQILRRIGRWLNPLSWKHIRSEQIKAGWILLRRTFGH